jgi:hypothetical protein
MGQDLSWGQLYVVHNQIKNSRKHLGWAYPFITTLFFAIFTCGLYYKHMTIVNDDSSVVSEQSF